MLVSRYEDKHYPIEVADPVDVIKLVMEQRGLRKIDMAAYMGGANRVSEVLSGKRALTLQMIANLHKGLNIPVEALIKV